MRKKIRVGILFGGKSAEHEVSLQSAKSVVEAIDTSRYHTVLIGIDRRGRWFLNDDAKDLYLEKAAGQNDGREVALLRRGDTSALVALETSHSVGELDVVFPVLHGPYGEDGSIQGLLKLAGIPYVGAGVLGSAIGMDKDVMKRLLRDAGIPVAPWKVLLSSTDVYRAIEDAIESFGLPFFVKPANLGSSIGVNKAHDTVEARRAVEKAFEYDAKVIIEQYMPGREIECSILGNDDPIVSVPGEIKPCEEFYSYSAKYLDEDGAELIIPADLDGSLKELVQNTARDVFLALCCAGMARVDMFLSEEGSVTVNEINTIPGFTKISMYPKLWEASGISFTDLITRLIDLGIEQFEKESRLKCSFE